MDAPAKETKKTSPSVPEEKAKPASVVHGTRSNWTVAICGQDLRAPLKGENHHSFTLGNEQITCLDCRQKLGLRLGPPDEGSGVDLWKLEQQAILRNQAANSAPPKKG